MRVVEIQVLDRSSLPEAMAGMRQWLDHRHFQPAVFRSTFKDGGLVLRIEFASAAEAEEFAQAFGGTIAEAQASAALQSLEVGPPPPRGSVAAGRVGAALSANFDSAGRDFDAGEDFQEAG